MAQDASVAAQRTVVVVPDADDARTRARAEWLRRAALVCDNAAADVPSPCVAVCRLDADRRFCEGCLRTLDEIRVWSTADDALKRRIWKRLAAQATADHGAS